MIAVNKKTEYVIEYGIPLGPETGKGFGRLYWDPNSDSFAVRGNRDEIPLDLIPDLRRALAALEHVVEDEKK